MNTATTPKSSIPSGTTDHGLRPVLASFTVGAAMLLASFGAQSTSADVLVPAVSTGGSGATVGMIVDAPVNPMTTFAKGNFGPTSL